MKKIIYCPRKGMDYMRGSGVLMHITSLPSPYGIGTLGRAAYNFVDFLKKAGQKYWQILPVGPTSFGDSPYQSFSTHAGNPYFVDLDLLAEDGLLEDDDYKDIDWGSRSDRVDYGKMYENRYSVLRKAYNRFKKGDMSDFNEFCAKNEKWISNYSLFMSIKNENDGKPWFMWDEGLKTRDSHSLWLFHSSHEDDMGFWMFIQYEFFKQWALLKSYANKNGVKIIGDIPFYVALDSAAVWVYPDLYKLDEKLAPTVVAGCPPDAFSPTGQLWGNPIYNWDRHRETGFMWWIDRIRGAMDLYDVVRIDHFRGFDSYYSIPAGNKTAEHGKWEQGPGMELFRAMEIALGKLPIIAEDLGFLTDSVVNMLKESGFPGMKIMEFAFYPNSTSEYLPHNFIRNCVAYPGTHDNDTIAGWLKSSDKENIKFAKKYMNIHSDDDFTDAFVRTLHASVADTVIVQMQDYLKLGSEARMNVPSVGEGNWAWRAKSSAFDDKLAKSIADVCRLYQRV